MLSDQVRYRVVPAASRQEECKAIWDRLHKSSDSFFISWPWVSTWINKLPAHFSPELHLIGDSEHPNLAFIGHTKKSRFLGFQLRQIRCGECGSSRYDDLVIEKNGMLFAESAEEKLSLADALSQNHAHILTISGIARQDYERLAQHLRFDNWNTEVLVKTSYTVDLDKVRVADKESGYLSLISSNKRRQIKKSISLFEENGAITISTASDSDQAIAFFKELCQLHQAEWKKRGKEGAFADDFMMAFHSELITNFYHEGSIRLYKITAGTKTIGIVYGFVSNNEFLYYQSGFGYEEDNRKKPGLSCHFLLIEKLSKEGLAVYDFLIGDYDYKKSLCTDTYEMLWVNFYSKHWLAKLRYYYNNRIKTLRPSTTQRHVQS